MIDKVMHFYWGNTYLSWMRYLTLFTFRHLNPEWKMILHLSSPGETKEKSWEDLPEQDFHNFTGRDYFRKVLELEVDIQWHTFSNFEGDTNPSYEGDFFKWKLLSENSGFYSDLDILYFRPFEILYSECKDSDIVICHNGTYFSIGLLGSSGKNRFFRDVYNCSVDRYTPDSYQSAGVQCFAQLIRNIDSDNRDGIKGAFDLFSRYYMELSFFNIPMETVYYWDSTRVANIFEKSCTEAPENSIGIHWYGGHPISQKYNNDVTDGNMEKFENTFCNFALGKI